MRTAALVLSVSLFCALGCAPTAPVPVPSVPSATSGASLRAAADGLVVEMVLPDLNLVRGETLSVAVTAYNTSRQSIALKANSAAPAYVTLSQRTTAGWEQVKRFPELAVMDATTWTLAAGQSRTFPLSVLVAPDWPTAEPLKLTAELNGRPDLRPGAYVQVFPTRAEYEAVKPAKPSK